MASTSHKDQHQTQSQQYIASIHPVQDLQQAAQRLIPEQHKAGHPPSGLPATGTPARFLLLDIPFTPLFYRSGNQAHTSVSRVMASRMRASPAARNSRLRARMRRHLPKGSVVIEQSLDGCQALLRLLWPPHGPGRSAAGSGRCSSPAGERAPTAAGAARQRCSQRP